MIPIVKMERPQAIEMLPGRFSGERISFWMNLAKKFCLGGCRPAFEGEERKPFCADLRQEWNDGCMEHLPKRRQWSAYEKLGPLGSGLDPALDSPKRRGMIGLTDMILD